MIYDVVEVLVLSLCDAQKPVSVLPFSHKQVLNSATSTIASQCAYHRRFSNLSRCYQLCACIVHSPYTCIYTVHKVTDTCRSALIRTVAPPCQPLLDHLAATELYIYVKWLSHSVCPSCFHGHVVVSNQRPE